MSNDNPYQPPTTRAEESGRRRWRWPRRLPGGVGRVLRVMALSAAWFGAGVASLYITNVYANWKDPGGLAAAQFDAIGLLVVSWFVIGGLLTLLLALIDRRLRD